VNEAKGLNKNYLSKEIYSYAVFEPQTNPKNCPNNKNKINRPGLTWAKLSDCGIDFLLKSNFYSDSWARMNKWLVG